MAQSTRRYTNKESFLNWNHHGKNIVPNLEAKASDRNPVFTPRQWLERFRQFTKREHKIDITPLLKGEDITVNEWAGKDTAVQKDFICAAGPEALHQKSLAEYKTEWTV